VEPLTVHEAYRLTELEEVLGDLRGVKNTEIGLVAQISRISVLLPEELAGKLQSLVGRRVGILRLDGYHVRCLDKEEFHA
jgi:hypothetical protein